MPGWIDDMTADRWEGVRNGYGSDRHVHPAHPSSLRFYAIPSRSTRSEAGRIAWCDRHRLALDAATLDEKQRQHCRGRLNSGSYVDYAAHLKSFVDYMAVYGIALYAVSLQNEPDVRVTYESCDWNAAEMLNS